MLRTNRLSVGVALAVVLACVTCAASAYTHNPSDFATEVVEYVEGTGVGTDWISGQTFNNPDCALDRPTVDTTGDGWYIPVSDTVPVVPVYPSFRAFELVTVGNSGSLTVKFDHKIIDNPLNPYGSDLAVFGNAFQVLGSGQGWINGDPNDVTVGGTGFVEPGIVSVSQDGVTWHTFGDGPYADDFAPTLGRVYDTENPDKSIGEWNDWWGGPTDPTLPLDPSLDFSSFDGWTVAQIAQAYDGSAGGAGFDIGGFALPLDPETGQKWIQYVWVDDDPGSSATTEIDAFADVAPSLAGDLSDDGFIGQDDLDIVLGEWGDTVVPSSQADPSGDGFVGQGDLDIVLADWGEGESQKIPEPASASLLLLGALAMLRRRKR